MVNQSALTSMYGQGKHFFRNESDKNDSKKHYDIVDHTTLKFMSESV